MRKENEAENEKNNSIAAQVDFKRKALCDCAAEGGVYRRDSVRFFVGIMPSSWMTPQMMRLFIDDRFQECYCQIIAEDTPSGTNARSTCFPDWRKT